MVSSVLTYFQSHDPRLMVWAAIACGIAAFGATILLRKIHDVSEPVRFVWIGITAFLIAMAIWATHYISLVAWELDFPVHMAPRMIVASMLTGVSVAGLGIALAASSNRIAVHFLGGAVVGTGIVAMQTVGTFGLVLGGTMSWNFGLLALAIVWGASFAGLAFVAAIARHLTLGSLCLSLAIFGAHALASSAIDLSAVFAVPAPGTVNADMMTVAATVMSILALRQRT